MRPLRIGLRRTVRSLGLRFGLLGYRPWANVTPDRWREAYASGSLAYFADLDELTRYSLIVGYVEFLGGQREIVDVGCGTGLLRVRLERVPFERYVGIDPIEEAIEQSRRLIDERTDFVVGDPLTADLSSFDVVVSNELLYGVRNPFAMIDRLAELARPGGHVITSMMRHAGDEQLWRRLDERLERLDTVDARNPANARAPRGWRVTLHRRP